jgi:hypothetical protein
MRHMPRMKLHPPVAVLAPKLGCSIAKCVFDGRRNPLPPLCPLPEKQLLDLTKVDFFLHSQFSNKFAGSRSRPSTRQLKGLAMLLAFACRSP